LIPKKYEMILFAFLMALFMSCFMSAVITFINLGIVEGFTGFWMTAFWKAFLVAFPTILIVVPQVRKVTAKLISKD